MADSKVADLPSYPHKGVLPAPGKYVVRKSDGKILYVSEDFVPGSRYSLLGADQAPVQREELPEEPVLSANEMAAMSFGKLKKLPEAAGMDLSTLTTKDQLIAAILKSRG